MTKLLPIILLLVFNLCQASPDSSTCAQLLRDIDWEIHKAGVVDAQYTRLPGHPILRTNRFLASFKSDLLNQAEKLEWLHRSARLGSLGLQVELLNLTRKISPDEIERITQCRDQFLDMYQHQPELIELALQHSKVPHGYRTLARVVGLYWLTRYITQGRIQVLQQEAKATFGTFQPGELIFGPVTAHVKSEAADRVKLFTTARQRSSLKIPTFTGAELESLLHSHAPYWAIAQSDDSDQPGSIGWHDGTLIVDNSRPASYQFLSYTRFNGDILPQLNYVIWFKRRPEAHLLDLYAGKLDSVIWRVTLRPDGQVLLFDSIHSCGCYHKFYLIDRALRPNSPERNQEQPLIFSTHLTDSTKPIVIHLTAASHYVIGLTNYRDEPLHQIYSLKEYNQLSNLPYKSSHRSVFLANGLVKGSERLERFLLWPMGVPSAGAMRQKGNHLTAFVGKRHFDGPDLLAKVFTYQPDQGEFLRRDE